VPDGARTAAEEFHSATKGRRFPEHGCDRTVLVFAELDSVLYRSVVELAAETIEHSSLIQTVGGSWLVRQNKLPPTIRASALLLEIMTTSVAVQHLAPEAQLHRAGRFVRRTSESMVIGARRAGGDKFSSPIHFTDAVCMRPPEKNEDGERETSHSGCRWRRIVF